MAKRAPKKLPFMPLATGDWLKDPNLRRCSPQARGVFIDLLCLMWESSPRGVLGKSSSPWSLEDAAGAVGGNQDVTLGCIKELLAKGPLARSKRTGRVFSRRMVRDELKRRRQARGGRKGMSNRWHNSSISPPISTSENEIENDFGVPRGTSEDGESLRADSARTREVNPAADYPVGRWFDRFCTLYPAARVGGVIAARRAFLDAADVGAGSWRCTPLEAAERLCVLAEEYAASERVRGRAKGHVPYAKGWLESGEWLKPEQWSVAEGPSAATPGSKAKERLRQMAAGGGS